MGIIINFRLPKVLNRVLNLNSKENMTKAEIMAIVVGTRLFYEIHLKDNKISDGLLVDMWVFVSGKKCRISIEMGLIKYKTARRQRPTL